MILQHAQIKLNDFCAYFHLAHIHYLQNNEM